MNPHESSMDPFAVLCVSHDASTEQISTAYYEGIRNHPPDRDPEGFKRIRAAYELLRDEESRAKLRLFGPAPLPDWKDVLDLLPREMKFKGPRLWLELLKEVRG